MVTRAQNIKLGIFVAGTLALLAVVLLVVSGVTFWKSQETYYVETDETVAGLEVGTPVTMRGVPVGRVGVIELAPEDPDRVRVTLQIDDEVRIPEGSKAFFRMAGLTGQKVLDLDEGNMEAGVLPPGSTIPRGFTSFQRIEDRALAFVDEATEVAKKSKELVSNLVDITDSVDPETVRSIVDDTDQLTGNLRDASTELEETLKETRRGVGEVAVSVSDTANRTGEMVDDAKEAVQALSSLLERSDALVRDNRDDVRRAVSNLRDATQNVEDLTRELQRRPSQLLFSSPPEERELP